MTISPSPASLGGREEPPRAGNEEEAQIRAPAGRLEKNVDGH